MLHVILTRFNIASPGREVAIRNSPGWLARRFDLFEQYCLPSVSGQIQKDFHWLIYFDSATPAEFRDRIEAAQKIHPFVARFVDFFDKQMIAEDVKALVSSRETLIVTTRLDNDDAIASDFTARVQTAAREAPADTVLNFTRGIAMRKRRLYTAVDHSNPFTSLVERNPTKLTTIWAKPHHQLEEAWAIRQIAGDPAWLQVVHGENVTNRIKGQLVGAINIIESFRIREDVAAKPATLLAVALDRVLLSPWRTVREAIFRAIKPLVLRLRSN